jgi:hypothetical protein
LIQRRLSHREAVLHMCDKVQVKVHAPATEAPNVEAHNVEAATVASRRRRIWELTPHCHCPLIGVALSLGLLRKLIGKVLGGAVLLDDYPLHAGAVADCGARNAVSQVLQKELERRYAGVVKQFHAAKSTSQLSEFWRAAMTDGDLAGAFWAGLTHPRCDAQLAAQMCHDLHMIQHQAGANLRADVLKMDALQRHNAQLNAELIALKQRSSAQSLQRCAEIAHSDGLLMQARTLAIARDGIIDALRAELAQLHMSMPALESRTRLTERVADMEQRERALKAQIGALKREKLPVPAQVPVASALSAESTVSIPSGAKMYANKHANERTNKYANERTNKHANKHANERSTERTTIPIRLSDQSVLCVGGRSGNVATYRSLIEGGGAQFAHHDGGLEDNVKLLDASLAAADLVICQTGCISHGAYWRVKDYCKRTGKRCVYIDNPSISSLTRSLQLVGAEHESAA